MINPEPTKRKEAEAQIRSDRRRYRRKSDSFPVRVTFGSRRPFRRKRMEGIAQDFDSEGFRIRLPSALAEGELVHLDFTLPKNLSSKYFGLACEWSGQVRGARPSVEEPGSSDVIVKLDRPVEALTEGEIYAHQRRVGAVVLSILLSMVWLKWDNMRFFWYSPSFYLYSFVVGAYFISRFAICRFYKPPRYVEGYTPSVSIVISARNEEAAIEATIDSCYAVDYPLDKIEVIAVDDGSTDGTPQAIERAMAKYPHLKARSIPPSGKRDGMATGVRLATGEIVVFVDSDTFLYPDALRHIVSGFQDLGVGAIAGNTEVSNARVNTLTGLQDVRYHLSFRLMKASESVFGCVSCCPGCLSAYRREYLVAVLDDWLKQTFLGAKATFGDDRSLTNYIWRNYQVLYNERAVCSTLVPETWQRYMKQQVRWKKSWLRETLIAARFAWKKHPVGALSFYVAAVCSLASPFMVFRAIIHSFVQPDAVLLYYFVGLLMLGLSQCLFVYLFRPSTNWLLGMLLVAAQVILMGPQTYYAMLTMRKNHWGTR